MYPPVPLIARVVDEDTDIGKQIVNHDSLSLSLLQVIFALSTLFPTSVLPFRYHGAI